jgi:hypothetical protein
MMITSNISFGQKMTSLQNTKKCPTKSQQKITGILQKIKVKVSHLNIIRVILICCVVKKENFITRQPHPNPQHTSYHHRTTLNFHITVKSIFIVYT